MALFGVQRHAASSSLFFQASKPKRTWTKFPRTTLGLRHSQECLKTNSPAQGMAIDEDDAYNQNSMEMSPDSGLADLWSSLSPFMENKGQEASAASQSLMGLSSSLFNDANSFVVDKEDPAEYIPAPAISAADAELNSQLETILYMLKEVLPGPMVKVGMDRKVLEAWSFVSDDIKVQDPLVCLEGKDRLRTWLHTLATTNAHLHLDEIYAERSRAHPCKGFIHAVWTLAFPKEPHSTLEHNTSSLNKCAQSSPSQLNLCGESKFEVDRIGQVTSIESKWHVTREGEEELDSLKLLLTSSLLKEVHS